MSGFAKVGHPGVICVCGARGDVEEFVGNVKAMQWRALRVRFVEALPLSGGNGERERRVVVRVVTQATAEARRVRLLCLVIIPPGDGPRSRRLEKWSRR